MRMFERRTKCPYQSLSMLTSNSARRRDFRVSSAGPGPPGPAREVGRGSPAGSESVTIVVPVLPGAGRPGTTVTAGATRRRGGKAVRTCCATVTTARIGLDEAASSSLSPSRRSPSPTGTHCHSDSESVTDYRRWPSRPGHEPDSESAAAP